MSEANLWMAMILAGIYPLIYIFTGQIMAKAFVRKRLKAGEGRGRIPANKAWQPFSLISLPIGSKLLKITPHNIRERLEGKLALSGTTWQLGEVLFLKAVLAFVLGFSCLLLTSILAGMVIKPFLVITLAALGFFFPDVLLNRKAQSRQKAIRHALPPFIDYLTVTVEAGLGLDIAIARVIAKLHGPLAEEVAVTMTEIKYGKPKREAFKNLAARVNLPELSSFLTALVNSETLGIGLSSILRIQGQQIRERITQKAHEKAYKIPIKLLFPMVFFILPGLFIVLLGPAVIKIIESSVF